jgi:hypothetical protein
MQAPNAMLPAGSRPEACDISSDNRSVLAFESKDGLLVSQKGIRRGEIGLKYVKMATERAMFLESPRTRTCAFI